MKKIDWDKISKKAPYEAPDGYFDKLPGIIQARTTERKKAGTIMVYLKWSLIPALAACLFVVFNWVIPTQKAPEAMLADVSTEELIYYLELTDASTEDIVDQMPSDIFEDDFMYPEDILNDNMDPEALDQLIEAYDINDVTL